MVSAVEPLAAAKHLAFKAEVPTHLPTGYGDERRIAQVLLNLVGNAIKFTDAGEVAIKASATNGSFTVAVHDRPRHQRRRPGQDLRRVPAGGRLFHEKEGRDGTWLVDRQAHRRNARRENLGQVEPRSRVPYFFFTLPVTVEQQGKKP